MNAGWFQDAQGDMTCVDSIVLNCGANNGNNTQNLAFTYGYRKPKVTQVGTIAFFSGGPGTSPADTPEEMSFAQDYLSAGYEIVQVKWSSDWEDTGSGSGTNVQYAACRPATFLKYVHDVTTLHPTGGMCAQGASAGAGAIGYALAWYGSYQWLDKVELLSGPVFSDIRAGCEEDGPDVPPTPVDICGSSDPHCVLGNGETDWSVSPSYISIYASSVRGWTGDPTCAIPGTTTSPTSNQNWLNQSIVNGTNNAIFNYQNTSIGGWMCRSFQGNIGPNNSAPESELFHRQASSGRQYFVYPVEACPNQENVAGSGSYVPALGGKSGYNAILADMTTGSGRCQLFH